MRNTGLLQKHVAAEHPVVGPNRSFILKPVHFRYPKLPTIPLKTYQTSEQLAHYASDLALVCKVCGLHIPPLQVVDPDSFALAKHVQHAHPELLEVPELVPTERITIYLDRLVDTWTGEILEYTENYWRNEALRQQFADYALMLLEERGLIVEEDEIMLSA